MWASNGKNRWTAENPRKEDAMKKKEKSKKEKRRNIFLNIFEIVVEGVLTILDAIFWKAQQEIFILAMFWKKLEKSRNFSVFFLVQKKKGIRI